MAAHGYEEERFESDVSKIFYCPICLNVLKDPVMCRRNQDPFCRGCITRHLANYPTCPVCEDELSLDTISDPSRIVTGYLADLMIRCEYSERGCEEIVKLQGIERHVEECGYAPKACSNEGCPLEVNRRDLMHHEYVECEERKLKCHNCERLSKDVSKMRRTLTAVSQKVSGMEERFDKKLDSFHNDLDSKVENQQKNIDNTLKTLKRRYRFIKDNLKELRKDTTSPSKKSKLEIDDDDSSADASQSSDSSQDTSLHTPDALLTKG